MLEDTYSRRGVVGQMSLSWAASWASIPKEELGKGTNARVRVLPDLERLYDAFEWHFLHLVEAHARQGRPASVVFPVGPIQFRRLAQAVNRSEVDLRHLHVFTMDEYCDAHGRLVPEDHPLSLRGFFRWEIVEALDPNRGFPLGNWIGPDPEDLAAYGRRIAQVGGIDVVYTGFGINGHWAFNDPPEPGEEVTLEEFAALPARVVTLSRETVVQMAMGGTDGDMSCIPPKAATIGPRDLLSAREIYCLTLRSWHSGVIRRALHGPVTPAFPASLIQMHPNVEVTITDGVAEPPRVLVLQRL
jgi:glucosamine-6-phosphate deaminase